MSPKVLIRCDGSSEIGLGHVMRCITLAEHLSQEGIEGSFVTRDLGGTASLLIRDRGFGCETLADDVSERDDAAAVVRLIETHGIAGVIVDNYLLGAEWWNLVRSRAALMAIDDLGRAGIDAHTELIVNQNAGAEVSWYPRTRNALVGPQYALIRSSLTKLRSHLREPGPDVRKILITMGGADPPRATLLAMEACQSLDVEELAVVIGPSFVHGPEVRGRAATNRRFRVHEQPPDLGPLMQGADLVITAGGATLYELALLGVPSVAVQIADNQRVNCSAMAEAGALVFAGICNELTTEKLRSTVETVMGDRQLRQAMSRAGQQMVDGQGAQRVARAICENLKSRAAG